MDAVEVGAAVRGEAAALVSERLEAELCLLAAHDASLMYRRLVMLAEFDRRELAGSWGMVSTAAWLAWRTSLDPRTAREQVRVAKALAGLPVTAEAMARGELTYSKVRALTRFVTPGAETELVELARHTTAAQLDVIAGWVVRVGAVEGSSRSARSSREPVVRTWFDDEGMGVLQVRLPPEDLALVLQALDALVASVRQAGDEAGSAEPPARADEPASAAVVDVDPESQAAWEGEEYVPGPGEPVFVDGCWVYPDDDDEDDVGSSAGGVDAAGGSAEPRPAAAAVTDLGRRRGEVFALMAARVLGGAGDGDDGFRGDRYLINVFADVSVLEGGVESDGQLNMLDDGSVISSAAVRRLACSEPLVLIVHDKDGNPLFMGRKTRLATTRQRRAALARSGGVCGFPACERKVWVQIHHCDLWGDGGPTDIDKLVPLCWFHHHCVHDGGFGVEPAPGGFVFFTPEGRRIEEVPSITGGLTLEQIREHLARPLRGQGRAAAPWSGSGERLDLDCTMSGVFSVLTRADAAA